MNIFGPSLNREEQNLRHIAGLGNSSSPISSEIKKEVSLAHSTPLSSLVYSVFSGATSALSYGITGSLLYPLAATDLRATILGATPEKVCEVCVGNRMRLAASGARALNYTAALTLRAYDFVDSFGVPSKAPKELVELTNSIFTQTFPIFLDTYAYLKDTVSPLFGVDMQECAETLSNCRWVNYGGSVIQTAESLIQHKYASHVVAALALWSFAQTYDLPGKSEARAIELLSEQYETMLETFKEKKDEARSDPSLKVGLKNIAEGIVNNQEQMLKELADLDLKGLRPRVRATMIKPIVNLAKEHLDSIASKV